MSDKLAILIMSIIFAAITDLTNKIRQLGLIWGENDIYIHKYTNKVTLQLSIMRLCMSTVMFFFISMTELDKDKKSELNSFVVANCNAPQDWVSNIY